MGEAAAGGARNLAQDEPAAATAGGEQPRPFRLRQEEIDAAVLVDVARGRAHGAGTSREAGGAGHVTERAVAQVPIEPRQFAACEDEQIDVAAIVEVGGHDGVNDAVDRDGRLGRDVAEPPIPVVAPERRGRGAGQFGRHEQVEVAVVVGIEPGRRQRSPVKRVEAARGRYVDEPVGGVAKQPHAGRPQDRDIRAAVVVEVADKRTGSRRRGNLRRQQRGRVHQSGVVIAMKADARPTGFDQVEVEVAIDIRERHRSGFVASAGGL